MSEETKAHLLMGGVKPELFAGLLGKPLKAFQGFYSEAATLEKTLQERRKFPLSQPQVGSIADIAREEIQRSLTVA